MRKLLLVMLVGLVLGLAGCATTGDTQSESRIRQRLKTYWSHMYSERLGKAWEMCTEKGREWLSKENFIKTGYKAGAGAVFLDKIHSVKILRPDYAEAIATLKTRTPKSLGGKEWKYEFEMVLKNGDWYLEGMSPVIDQEVLDGEREPTLDEIRDIGLHKKKGAIQALKKVIETNEDADFRSSALESLMDLGPSLDDVLPIFVRVLKEDPSRPVKWQVVWNLDGIEGDKRVIPLLMACLSNKSFSIQEKAVSGLGLTQKRHLDEVMRMERKLSWLSRKLKKAKTPEEQQKLEKEIQRKEIETEQRIKQLKEEYEEWWQKNKDYLYWDEVCFEIDEEAKTNKTPIDPDTRKPLTEAELQKWREEEKEIEKIRQDLEKTFQQQWEENKDK